MNDRTEGWDSRTERAVTGRGAAARAGEESMSRFAVEVAREPGYAVLRTDGYLNNLGAERIEQEYDALVAQGCRNFVVNFARSPIINSMGLAILLGIIEKNLTHQGTIVFSNLTEVNAETMEIMDNTQYVTLGPTEDDARAVMAQQAGTE